MALLEVGWEARFGIVGFSLKDSVSVHSPSLRPFFFFLVQGRACLSHLSANGKAGGCSRKEEGSCAFPADNPKQRLCNSSLAALAPSYLKERLIREQSTFISQ